MRLVIQRVSEAEVKVGDEIIGKIGKGLLILVGIACGDTDKEVEYLASKTASLRIFDDENGVMNLSVMDIKGKILAVSQFTLLAETKKGNRPSYINAMRPPESEELYNLYCSKLEEKTGEKVEKGQFGADMKVSLTNDGPVTILYDTTADK